MNSDPSFEVVDARRQDVPEILDVFRVNGQFVPEALEVLNAWDTMSGVPLVAREEVSGQVIGFCSLVPERQFRGGVVVHAENVVVDPRFQGMGVGSMLMKRIIKEARERQALREVLECQRQVVPFYQALGFEMFGHHLAMRLPQGD